jgi:hypothetical protein
MWLEQQVIEGGIRLLQRAGLQIFTCNNHAHAEIFGYLET